MALKILAAKLAEEAASTAQKTRDAQRKDHVGSGMRGDKVRTYSTVRDSVVDHKTGRSWTLTKWTRGEW
jgi:peptide chain release factor 1